MTTIRDAFNKAVEVIATTFRERMSELEEKNAALQKENAHLRKEVEQLLQNQQSQQSHASPSPPPAVATIKQSEFVDLVTTHDTLHSQVEELEQRVQSEVKGTDPSSLVATLSRAIKPNEKQGNVKEKRSKETILAELRTKKDFLVKLLTKAKSILFPMLEKANNLRDACEKQSQTIFKALSPGGLGEGNEEIVNPEVSREGPEMEIGAWRRLKIADWNALGSREQADVHVAMYVAAKKLEQQLEKQQMILGGQSRRLKEGYKICRELRGKIGALGGNVKTCVRARALQNGEKQDADFHVHVDRNKIDLTKTSKNIVDVREEKVSYQLDRVFGPSDGQDAVYEETTKPLVESVIGGDNGCAFVYGETGSGKSFTMFGDKSGSNDGLVQRTTRELFAAKEEILRQSTDATVTFEVEVTEIYLNKERDLLADTPGSDGGVVEPKNAIEAVRLIETAESKRKVRATKCNKKSSRGHVVVTMRFAVEENGVTRTGKLQMCDLAGRERTEKSGVVDKGKEEADAINQSLSALSLVIEALKTGKQPTCRGNLLTMTLKESLIGNSKTVAIVCCSPSASHHEVNSTSLDVAKSLSQLQLEACATQNRATTANKSKAGKKSEPGNGALTRSMKQRGQSTTKKQVKGSSSRTSKPKTHNRRLQRG